MIANIPFHKAAKKVVASVKPTGLGAKRSNGGRLQLNLEKAAALGSIGLV